MSSYHALAQPMEKASWALAKTVGRSLFTNGLWSTAAKGAERVARRGGRFGTLAGHAAPVAHTMAKVSPYLGAYGLAGAITGKELPGADMALAATMPGWAALDAVPSAIRSGRLATGNYDKQIEADARAGSQQAGRDWITGTQRDARTAADPAAYQRFLQENGADTSGVANYQGARPTAPGWWRTLSNGVSDPTANVLPAVQQRIYDQTHKSAMDKSAWPLAALGAGRAAWTASRAVPGVMGALKAGPAALKAGVKATPYLGAGASFAKRYGMPAMNAAFLGGTIYGTGTAITDDKPYDEAAVQQEGYDGTQAAIQDRLGKMNQFERMAAQFDPSLAVNKMERAMPGTVASWEQQNGQPYQRGILGGIQNSWNNSGTPRFYSTDAGGTQHYL